MSLISIYSNYLKKGPHDQDNKKMQEIESSNYCSSPHPFHIISSNVEVGNIHPTRLRQYHKL